MRNILLGSLALILSAGLAACEDNANGEAPEGAEADSAAIQEALPEADVLKPADPNIPEIDLSQPAPVIAGPSADTGETGMDGTGMDGTGMGGTGMPGEEGRLDQAGAPEGAPAEGASPAGAGEGPGQAPIGEEPGAGAGGMGEAPAEDEIGTEEREAE